MRTEKVFTRFLSLQSNKDDQICIQIMHIPIYAFLLLIICMFHRITYTCCLILWISWLFFINAFGYGFSTKRDWHYCKEASDYLLTQLFPWIILILFVLSAESNCSWYRSSIACRGLPGTVSDSPHCGVDVWSRKELF